MYLPFSCHMVTHSTALVFTFDHFTLLLLKSTINLAKFGIQCFNLQIPLVSNDFIFIWFYLKHNSTSKFQLFFSVFRSIITFKNRCYSVNINLIAYACSFNPSCSIILTTECENVKKLQFRSKLLQKTSSKFNKMKLWEGEGGIVMGYLLSNPGY